MSLLDKHIEPTINGVKELYLIRFKDIVWDFRDGELYFVRMKRKYGKFKREVVKYEFEPTKNGSTKS